MCGRGRVEVVSRVWIFDDGAGESWDEADFLTDVSRRDIDANRGQVPRVSL